jgi:hypothetical protein
MRFLAPLIAVLLLAAPAFAQDSYAAFRKLRAEGVAAINAGDMATARAKLAQADAAVPNHPALTLLRAQVEAADNKMDAGVTLMKRYADFGLTTEVMTDEMLQRLSIENSFVPVARQFTANEAPMGLLKIEGQFDGPWLAEGLAWDEARKRWLISGAHSRTILSLKGTKIERFLDAKADTDGVMGIVADPARGLLWAASSGLPQAKGLAADRRGKSALLKIDLKTGKLLQRYPAPDGQAQRSFGDVALGAGGEVYVSDSISGEVLRLAPGAAALSVVVPAGALASPQGLFPTPDGKRLIVADYVTGLQVIDLATGAASRLPVPDTASLIGTDGLIRDGSSLLAVQNGSTPQRVLRLDFDPEFTRVERWTTVAANLPNLEQPTGGVVVGDDLVLISYSQWSDFKDDGSLRHDRPNAVVLARIQLRAPKVKAAK